jgi:hypothetical protein
VVALEDLAPLESQDENRVAQSHCIPY